MLDISTIGRVTGRSYGPLKRHRKKIEGSMEKRLFQIYLMQGDHLSGKPGKWKYQGILRMSAKNRGKWEKSGK